MSEATALTAVGLGKRYGTNWALRDCSLEIPSGTVTALVGPNGAGKTTLLQLAIGLRAPTAGSVRVFGLSPSEHASGVLPRIGFLAQDHPLYTRFTIGETLKLGRKLNATWDDGLATRRIESVGLALEQKVGTLSGGQQAQVALTLALAKRPELLLLDEPVAALDPLARREFLQTVMEAVAQDGITVILSSHIVADLERVCDHLVILSRAHVQLAGSIDEIVVQHRLLTGPRCDASALGRIRGVIRASHTDRQATVLVRAEGHVYDAVWEVHPVDLEEIVLAYLSLGTARAGATPPPVYEAVRL